MQHSHLFVNSLVVTIFSDFPLPLADPLLPLLQALGLLPLEVLDHLEDECVLGQDPEHVDDAGHHPGLHRCETFQQLIIISLSREGNTMQCLMFALFSCGLTGKYYFLLFEMRMR